MDKQITKICVVGLGYIGLPTASFLGTKGYDVIGVDISPSVVDTINSGNIHIVEPDLDILVKSAVNAGRLKAALQPEEADVFIIAVPTPIDSDHIPSLQAVEQAARAILPFVRPGNLIILESTSPVGTTENIVARIMGEAGWVVGEDLFIAHCPERVLPGRILTELVENDRIVGGVDEVSTRQAAEFYRSFVRGDVLETTAATAELTKLTENAYRDVNIAFANEMSMICDQFEINPWELIQLANRHPRVNILQPGPGVGGHCIAVDPWFIVSGSPERAKLIRAAREVNDYKTEWVLEKVRAKAAKFRQPCIACLGLAFKADVDDLRESPAMEVVQALMYEQLGDIIVCEPNLKQHPDFDLLGLEEAVRRADILLLLVDHRAFKQLRAADLKEKVLIDTRGVVS